jgi:hypothetical protein
MANVNSAAGSHPLALGEKQSAIAAAATPPCTGLQVPIAPRLATVEEMKLSCVPSDQPRLTVTQICRTGSDVCEPRVVCALVSFSPLFLARFFFPFCFCLRCPRFD